MKKLYLSACIALLLLHYGTHAQYTPINGIEYIDINKVKAAIAMHGDLWWDPAMGEQRCEFPKGSGKKAGGTGSIWMGGHSSIGQLHVAAQTFRTSGNDLWPGPVITGVPAAQYASSQQWARVWKINYTDIQYFRSITTHTANNTPTPIMEWPARNNPYAKGANGAALIIATDMAPFKDVDGDGKYDPLKGDYPDMKGDQMLWWVFNDNGATRDNSMTETMMLEVKAKAYAYNRGTLLDNIVYYEYNITNKSGIAYPDFRCGIWTDADLGYFRDDYIGFDSSRRLGIIYNANIEDGTGQPEAYGKSIPVAGIALMEVPGDNAATFNAAGSFMYFNNDASVTGNPTNGTHFNNYLRSMWKDGQQAQNDYVAPSVNSKGRGTGPNTDYVYTGSPKNPAEWSECQSGNYPDDRRFVLSMKDHNFTTGSTIRFAFAQVFTDTSVLNSCDAKLDFAGIKNVADTALKYYWAAPVMPPPYALAVNNVFHENALALYPNPAKDILHIDNTAPQYELILYDALGRRLQPLVTRTGNRVDINVVALPQGVYSLVYRAYNDAPQTALFLKE